MAAETLVNPVALGWLLQGEWRAHPARVIVAAMAIAVGVALGFAIHVVNQSALGAFGHAVRAVNGDADLQIQAATPVGFDEALYPRVARLAGVGQASPVVELTAMDGETALTLLGLDAVRAAAVTPSLIAWPAAGGSVFDPTAIHLSAGALAAGRHRIGESMTLVAGGHAATFVIAGTIPGADDGPAIAVIDIAAAQWRFGQLGRLQRIDLRITDERATVEAALRTVLPANATIASAVSAERRSDSLSRAYRVNLEMLAMVALLTGGFLVYSAQSLSVARRQTQFALLRVLGMLRRALVTQVIVEGALVGVVGAIAGIGVGYAVATLAVTVLGGDLGGGYFSPARPHLVFPALAAVVLSGLGLLVAMAGSVLPALASERVQPAVALKNAGPAGDPRRPPTVRRGLVLLAIGGALALAPPVAGLPLFGYLAIALILGGGVAAMSGLARALLAPLQRRGHPNPALDLAAKRLWAAPGQASVALCGIVASTSLAIAMAVMVSSFRGSVEDWLTQLTPADLYLRIDHAEAGGLSPDLQAQLAAAPGVASAQFRKTISVLLWADQPAVALIARPIDAQDAGRSLPLIGASAPVPPGAIPVWISEPMVYLYGHHPGDRLLLPLDGQAAQAVYVAGVWRDYRRQYGSVVMATADYTRLTGDADRTEAAIDLAPGVTPEAATAALRSILPPALRPQTDIGEPRAIRALALRIFDRSFAVTYALEAIAIVVGLTGVAATLSAQTLARAKEFGMLRHIGVLRRQIILMLAVEGALLGTIGIIAGLGLGIAMSQVLIHVVNPQSFHWTMQTRLPYGLFAGLTVAMIAAAAGTAVIAGRHALSVEAVRAVREDS